MVFGGTIESTSWMGIQLSVLVWDLEVQCFYPAPVPLRKPSLAMSLSPFQIITSFKDKDWSLCPLWGGIPRAYQRPATGKSFAQEIGKYDQGPHYLFSFPMASIPIPQINTTCSHLIKLFSIS